MQKSIFNAIEDCLRHGIPVYFLSGRKILEKGYTDYGEFIDNADKLSHKEYSGFLLGMYKDTQLDEFYKKLRKLVCYVADFKKKSGMTVVVDSDPGTTFMNYSMDYNGGGNCLLEMMT